MRLWCTVDGFIFLNFYIFYNLSSVLAEETVCRFRAGVLSRSALLVFVVPFSSDKKPKGVVSLPGCVAEAVEDDDNDTNSEISNGSSAKKEPRKSRVPKGYHGLRYVDIPLV